MIAPAKRAAPVLVIDPRPVLMVIGLLLTVFALGMAVPAAVDAYHDNPDWRVFALAGGATLFVGLALIFANRSGPVRFNLRQAFLLTVLAWTTVPAFAALPFVFSDMGLSYTDAYFEAMSGVTTSGATVIAYLDVAPPGILMWRALLQWLGGIGILVMVVAVLPMLKIGGLQLFRVEDTGAQERLMPRAAQITGFIGLVYVCMTLALVIALWLAGMDAFDAWAHAMSTISTGGFSTHDASIGHYDNLAIEIAIMVGMTAGGLPFILFVQALRGNWRDALKDDQMRWYLALLSAATLSIFAWLWLKMEMAPGPALRVAAFQVISVMTSTGFVTADYGGWGHFAVTGLFFLMFVGGCAGSTAAGIKIFRLISLLGATRAQIHRLLRPHGVFLPYFNGKPIPEPVSDSIMGFFFVYCLTFTLFAMALGLMGLDLMSALSGAATALSNVGPGLGDIIGPAGNFSAIPAPAKWLISFGMMFGRLELFAVLVLFVPSFWRG